MNSLISNSLSNQLLIATPWLSEGIFKSSVTYICEHNEEGTMGIIINRPSNLMVQDVLSDLGETPSEYFESKPVMLGGPVGLERGFVLHQNQQGGDHWMSTLKVTDEVSLTGSRDILEALNEGKGPNNFLLALGYAGWASGQLEQELLDNAWLSLPATLEILFATPIEQIVATAAKQLGVDLTALALHAGNA